MGPDKNEFSKSKPIKHLNIKRSIADRYPRNALCLCKSGKKYKHCCWRKGNEPGPDFVTLETELAKKKEVTYAIKKYKRLTSKPNVVSELQEPSIIIKS